MKRRPIPQSKKHKNRPEPDPKRKLRDDTDRRSKKYGPLYTMTDDELEEFEEFEEPGETEEIEEEEEI